MTEKLTKEAIAEGISNLTVLELSELVKMLEDKFGIKAQAAGFVASAGAVAASGSAAPAADKTEFNVVLTNAGANKIQVIKVIREITGLGLKEAKDFVDGVPKVIKENIPKDQAEDIKKKVESAGGQVEIK